MLDTTAMTRLISTGTTKQALPATVSQLFPNPITAQMSQALQVGRPRQSGGLTTIPRAGNAY